MVTLRRLLFAIVHFVAGSALGLVIAFSVPDGLFAFAMHNLGVHGALMAPYMKLDREYLLHPASPKGRTFYVAVQKGKWVVECSHLIDVQSPYFDAPLIPGTDVRNYWLQSPHAEWAYSCTYAYGAPFRAFTDTIWLSAEDLAQEGIMLQDQVHSGMLAPRDRGLRQGGIRLVWSGIAGNGLIFGLLLSLCWLIPRQAISTARRAWRHYFGHCRECGYSSGGLRDDRCPECGQALPSDMLTQGA